MEIKIKNMGFFDKFLKIVTFDKMHRYEGPSGKYFKLGSSKSGRKGRTLFWWNSKK